MNNTIHATAWKYRFIHTVALGLAVAGATVAPVVFGQRAVASDAARPNIVFILADDMGWGDPSLFAGHPYVKTPNLDRLAKEGTRFERFYVAATVCTPSRCAFMTGRFPASLGITDVGSIPPSGWLNPDLPNVPRLLKDAGYMTGHFGKWHMGGTLGDTAQRDLRMYGLDEYRVFVSSVPRDRDLKFTVPPAGTRYPEVDTAIISESVAFIRDNKDRAFYLQVWTRLPHAPLNPTAEELAVYDGLDPDPTSFPPRMREYYAEAKKMNQIKDFAAQLKTYLASITSLDAGIGRILHTLDELHLSENTLVFFSSDNGPEIPLNGVRNAGTGSSGPFRARKRSHYEGGIRTPCIVRWPGKVPSGQIDKDSVICGVDWLPTACAVAGVTPPPGAHLEGESVLDILCGKSRSRRTPLFWYDDYDPPFYNDQVSPALAVMEGQWKLLIDPEGARRELYHIPADPEERNNLAAAEPAVVKELTERAKKWYERCPYKHFTLINRGKTGAGKK